MGRSRQSLFLAAGRQLYVSSLKPVKLTNLASKAAIFAVQYSGIYVKNVPYRHTNGRQFSSTSRLLISIHLSLPSTNPNLESFIARSTSIILNGASIGSHLPGFVRTRSKRRSSSIPGQLTGRMRIHSTVVPVNRQPSNP